MIWIWIDVMVSKIKHPIIGTVIWPSIILVVYCNYFEKNNTYSYLRWLKLRMRVMRHTVNMNQVKNTQKSNSFLTNIITNTLFFPLVNYLIFFLKAGHSAHRVAKYTHTSTISTNSIHIAYILDCLKSRRGHSSMLSSYNSWQTAYLFGLGEAENACQVSRRLKATNRMITHKNTVIILKSYTPTTSRTPSMHKCKYTVIRFLSWTHSFTRFFGYFA